jgi:hypothetical protein
VRLRTILFSLLLLLILGLGAAAWWLPARIDWQGRRAEIESAAAAVLGRPVLLREEFSFRLLPRPAVAARGLSVVDIGDGFSIEAAEVRLALRFWPLLAGRVVATDIVLVRPTIALSGITPPAFPALLAPAWIAEADVRIEDGMLSVAGITVQGVVARVSGEGMAGPFALDGDATLAGRRLRFMARLDRADALGTARLELSVAGQAGLRAELEAVGLVALPTLTFAGRARAVIEDLSQLAALPAMPATLDLAQVTASPVGIASEDLRLVLGPAGAQRQAATGTGAAAFRPDPARLDVALSFPLIDLDPWLQPLAAAVGAAGLPIGLELAASSVSVAGGTLRDAKLVARSEGGQAAINQASAVLPGAASVSLSGVARRGDGGLMFEGLASLDAADLRAGLAWLGAPTDWAAPGRLRTARGSAQLTLGAGLLQLASLDAAIDGVRLAGGLVLNTAAARPSFGAGLTIERIEPESWLAQNLADPAALASRLAGVDANLRLETPLMVLRGIAARDVSLDATLEAGRLSVRRLSAGDLGGARAVLAGAMTLLPQPRVAELRLEMETADSAGLVPLLPEGLAPSALFAGAGLLRLSGRAADDALAIETEAELSGARLELRGVVDAAQPRLAGSIALRHPGARRLLRALGEPGLAGWVGDGSLSVLGQVEMTPVQFGLSGFELVAGGVRGGGDLVIGLAGPPMLKGRLAFESLDLPLPESDGRPLPVAWLRGGSIALDLAAREVTLGQATVHGVEAELRLADGRLSLARGAGQWAGGQLAVSGAIDLTRPAPDLQGELQLSGATVAGPLAGTPFDLAAGQVGARMQLAARGHGVAALLATLSGAGEFSVTQGVLSGFDLAAASAALRAPAAQADALARLRAALSGGATAFDRLQGALRLEAGSVLFDQVTLNTDVGSATLSGLLDLAQAAVDVRVVMQPTGAEALPEVAVRLTGPAGAPRRVFDTAAAARWLADRP